MSRNCPLRPNAFSTTVGNRLIFIGEAGRNQAFPVCSPAPTAPVQNSRHEHSFPGTGIELGPRAIFIPSKNILTKPICIISDTSSRSRGTARTDPPVD